MRLLIVGATPFGAYLAAHCQFLGQRAVWLADVPTAEAVTRVGGVQLISQRVRRTATGINITAAPDQAYASAYDVIFFTMQGYDTAAALMDMSRHRAPGQHTTPIVSFQRGIGNAERIASVYGARNVIRAGLSIAADSPLPESVVLMPSGGVALADDHPFSAEIAALLSAAYLPVTLENGRDALWSALFWQIYGNAIPALLDLPLADVLSSPTLFTLEYRQLIEALGILQALNVRLIDLPDAPVSRLATQLQALPAAWLPGRLVHKPDPPSLRVELAQNARRSEAAYLNGAIALYARDRKLSAPINHALALTLQDIADRRALWSQFQRNPRMVQALISMAAGR